VANFDYDMMLFFSPAGVQALNKNFPDFQQGDIKIGTFGPATAKEVTEKGLRLDLSAPTPEFPSMTGALRNFLKNQQ
jgi:uroporphyrinogen-III synthase